MTNAQLMSDLTPPLHAFDRIIGPGELPARFTYPFCYTPHPLCREAARKVGQYLEEQNGWHEELQKGKMFGVLVVRTPDGRVAFLAAFSGILAGTGHHPYFVPPVYDLLRPDGFFKPEEEQISQINRRIAGLEADDDYLKRKADYERFTQESTETLAALREELKRAKHEREARRREGNLTEAERTAMVGESQFQKAEYKRRERATKQEAEALHAPIRAHEALIQNLKEERKSRSAALQARIFAQFRMLNARGEVKDLGEIFAPTTRHTPPAGAGECAGPKLLQYAYLHHLTPIAMAEFWWGESPKAEVRRHGHYYPACKGKCEPILGHMLEGLEVNENPFLIRQREAGRGYKVIYEDEYLLVINKPAGMLTVPCYEPLIPSVYSITREQHPEAEGPLIVHRLDMDTSGLLVVAKTKEAHYGLQMQFEARTVKKRYIALLAGHVNHRQGTIDLPLCPNPLDRPRQMADPEHGKPALTHYEVLGYEGGLTRVAFYPVTGRTHQLRVHAAHASGLHHPIVGDPLYGERADRLCLHAEMLEFRHPVSGNRMEFHCAEEF